RFIHVQVPVNRNACADRHLLGAQGEIVGACRCAGLDKDLAMVAKMNEIFAFMSAEYISLWRRKLSRIHAVHQCLANAEPRQPLQKSSAFFLFWVRDNLSPKRVERLFRKLADFAQRKLKQKHEPLKLHNAPA
ncbi:MAG: hypothetical protein WCD57_15475, partial [Acidobacteriaceae bacterium]